MVGERDRGRVRVDKRNIVRVNRRYSGKGDG